MNRLTGIIIAVSGVLVAVLGFTKILPNLGWTGIFLILLGGLLFGLSFIPMPQALESEPMSLPEKLLKMFYAPTEVFKNLRRYPSFLGVILIMSVISGAYTYAFFQRVTPERITNHTIEKLAESGWVPADQMEKVKQDTLEQNSNPIARVGQSVNSFIGLVFLMAFLGLVFWLITLAFGGQINYFQAIAATAFAFFPITLIQKSLSLLILYLKDPSEIHPILGQTTLLQDSLNFLIAPSASPVLYTLLSSFGLLAIYWIWLQATGLKNTGESVSPTAAWASAILIWVFGLGLGVVLALVFGNFMS